MKARLIYPRHLFWALALLLGMALSHRLHSEEQISNLQHITETHAEVLSLSHRDHYSYVQFRLEGYRGRFVSIVPRSARLSLGDQLLVSGELKAPRGFSALSGFLRVEGKVQVLKKNEPDFFDSCRLSLSQRFRKALPGDRGAMTAALFLGDRSDFYVPAQKNFQYTGTLHYLALSGLHLALVLLPFMLIFRLLRLTPKWQLLACVPVLIFYLCLVGYIPSLMRAFVSFIFVVVAVFFERKVDKFNALCLVALICLAIDYSQVHSAGFYMTFSALAGIVFLGPRLLPLWPQKETWWWKVVAYNAGAWLGIAPVLLFFFGELYPTALVINIVLIPVFTLLMSCCLFFVVWPSFFALLLKALWWVIEILLTFSLLFLERPWGPSQSKELGLLFAVLLCVFLLWRQISVRQCFSLLLFVLLMIMMLPEEHPFESARVRQLDVGQGSCYLLEVAPGQGILVDCGGSSLNVGFKSIVPRLRKNGVKKIPYIFLTHLDRDHRVGLEDILARFDVGCVVSNKGSQHPARKELQNVLKRYRVPWREIERGQQIICEGQKIVCCHPSRHSPGPENERGLVLLFHGKKKSILFTGDVDERGTPELLRSGFDLRADILVAPHHGSFNRYSSLILKAVQPTEIWLSARENFPKDPLVLDFPLVKKSWQGDVETEF